MDWGRYLSKIKRLVAYRVGVQAGIAASLQMCGRQVRGYSVRVQSGFVSGVKTSKNTLRALCKRLGLTSVRARDGLVGGFQIFGHHAHTGSKHFLAYAGRFQKSFIFGLRVGGNGLSSLCNTIGLMSIRVRAGVISGFKRGIQFLQTFVSSTKAGFVGVIRASCNGLVRVVAAIVSGSKIIGSIILSGFRFGFKFFQAIGYRTQVAFVNLVWLSGKVLTGIIAGLQAMGYKIWLGLKNGIRLLVTPLAYRIYAMTGAAITVCAMVYYYQGLATSSMIKLKQLDQSEPVIDAVLNRQTVKALEAQVQELEAKATAQEQIFDNKIAGQVEKFEAALTATTQQLKQLEEKLSVQNQAIEQKISAYAERIEKPVEAESANKNTLIDDSQKVEQVIKDEVSEQLGLLRLKLKEKEKKQKRKKMFDRFLNQLAADDKD